MMVCLSVLLRKPEAGTASGQQTAGRLSFQYGEGHTIATNCGECRFPARSPNYWESVLMERTQRYLAKATGWLMSKGATIPISGGLRCPVRRAEEFSQRGWPSILLKRI